MARLTYKQLKDIVNSDAGWQAGCRWHEVAKFGKTASREAIIKHLLAIGYKCDGLALDDKKEEVAPKEGTIAYTQMLIGKMLGLDKVSRGTVNNELIEQLDHTKVSNGIVAITLKGLSGKKYWDYAYSVCTKILMLSHIENTLYKELKTENEESTLLTDEEKYAEMDAFAAKVDKETEDKWNAYCDEQQAINDAIDEEDNVKPLSDGELIDVIHRMTIENQVLDAVEDAYWQPPIADTTDEDIQLFEQQLAITNPEYFERYSVYFRSTPERNYIIDMFLLAFDVKLTATVIELYCAEISKEIDKGKDYTPVNDADKLGTQAMHLGFDANDLLKAFRFYSGDLPGWYFDSLNYCIHVIQPIITTLEFLELQLPTETFYWDTDRRTLVCV